MYKNTRYDWHYYISYEMGCVDFLRSIVVQSDNF